VVKYIRDEPLGSLAIAAAAGLILGGGLNSRVEKTMLTIVGRLLLQSAAVSFLAGLLTANGTSENGRANSTSPHS
jgi:hypothetical protein